MQPTYYGTITDYSDAQLLVKAVIQGDLPSCKERLDPNSKRRIEAGQIFVFLESQCELKRWTDSIRWSKSRKVGDFFFYRQVDAKQRILLEGGLRKKTCQVQVNGYTFLIREIGHVICYFEDDRKFISPVDDPLLEHLGNANVTPKTDTKLPQIPRALTFFPYSYFK